MAVTFHTLVWNEPLGKKPRILVAGDAGVPTGFARVLFEIFNRLAAKYEIHHLGTNYHGDPHKLPWDVYPADTGGDPWGIRRIGDLAVQLKPDAVFLLNDIWVIKEWVKALEKLDKAPPIISYVPIDSSPIEHEAVEHIQSVAKCVAYTKFGADTILAALERLPETCSSDLPKIEIVGHGIDTATFKPLGPMEDTGYTSGARLRARKALFPDSEDLWTAFIVLNANRNQPRKRIDTTIRAFAHFSHDKPKNVKLFLHMGVEDQGWNVVQLARRYGIDDRLIMSTMESGMPAKTSNHLNHVYNACDVGLNTATGEGWGLVAFEHAATKAAQVMPRCGASVELWGDSALLVEPSATLVNERILTEALIVSPEDVSRSLEKLYSSKGYLCEMGERAYQNTIRPAFNWDVIAEKWDSVFSHALDGLGI